MSLYTAITFAPVQGFIEKSRKLRDLYGSSFILSYLAESLCRAAQAHLQDSQAVVSPFLLNTVQGTPNQILIRGDFPKTEARRAFYTAWRGILTECRLWIEQTLPEAQYGWRYFWKKDWDQWSNYTWEFFWAQGSSIPAVKQQLNAAKRSRGWTGINWMGESSTLSGTDAIAWYGLGQQTNARQRISPKERHLSQEKEQIKDFYIQLSAKLGETLIDPNEELSIPELAKRVVMHPQFIHHVRDRLPGIQPPRTFRDLNRMGSNDWTGWFMGDGDRAGVYLSQQDEAGIRRFSQTMREWGKTLIDHEQDYLPQGRFIYAGGDDFMGIFYPLTAPLTAQDCLHWFYRFRADVWQQATKPITASLGFVWASPNVPQRDVLQHCREAEQSAKKHGRDRLAVRILFSGGNALEWVCPWWFLEAVMEGYRDRNGDQGSANYPKWNHLYSDVAVLEARHAFAGNQTDVALALFEVYFGKDNRATLEQHCWDTTDKTGILGNHEADCKNTVQATNDWIINLAKVGFHLAAGRKTTAIPPQLVAAS
jgi:CRISPR-associated protein Cmr2